MWKYIRQHLHIAVIAGSFMIGEVLTDLLQPGLMREIVDEGVLGLSAGGVGNMTLVWSLGIRMACLVIFGGLCRALNNVFAHMTGQNASGADDICVYESPY
ncbi:MAG: ABC transporter ATP-binding protein [Lachnospiraceae bacterium]|nr:ABC transporter ATP-binding protein [Lachnospiraceae bacterium]